jgi:hypothetical protein
VRPGVDAFDRDDPLGFFFLLLCRAFGFKDALDFRPQMRLIVLQRQNVIGSLLTNLLSDLLLRPHRVDRHDAALERKQVQQFGDRPNLIRFLIDFGLPLFIARTRCNTDVSRIKARIDAIDFRKLANRADKYGIPVPDMIYTDETNGERYVPSTWVEFLDRRETLKPFIERI